MTNPTPDFRTMAKIAFNNTRKMSATEDTVINAIAVQIELAFKAGREKGLDEAIEIAMDKYSESPHHTTHTFNPLRNGCYYAVLNAIKALKEDKEPL